MCISCPEEQEIKDRFSMNENGMCIGFCFACTRKTRTGCCKLAWKYKCNT